MSRQKTTASYWEEDYRDALFAGTSTETRRAYHRDIRYFWAWAKVAHGTRRIKYPVPAELFIQFILDHSGRMEHSLEQQLIAEGLRTRPGPLRIKTIKRYLASVSVAHNEAGVHSPLNDERVRLLLRRIQHSRVRETSNKKEAITAELLKSMLAQCDDSLLGLRDKALLSVGFASGGRRRSELVSLEIGDLKKADGGYLLNLRCSKTDQAGRGMEVPILGEAGRVVSQWLMATGLREGKLFRGFTPQGKLTGGLCGKTINRIVKKYIAAIGLDPAHYGAHSLRSGFITEAGRQGLFLPDAMALSGHRSLDVARAYYRNGELLRNPTSYLLD